MQKKLSLIWIALTAAIIMLSLVPHLLVPPNNTDKILHIYAYCVLILAPALALRRRLMVGALAGLLFTIGIANEIMQHFIGGRQASVEDALANGIGLLVGLLIAYLLRHGWNADERGVS